MVGRWDGEEGWEQWGDMGVMVGKWDGEEGWEQSGGGMGVVVGR